MLHEMGGIMWHPFILFCSTSRPSKMQKPFYDHQTTLMPPQTRWWAFGARLVHSRNLFELLNHLLNLLGIVVAHADPRLEQNPREVSEQPALIQLA